VSGVYVDVAPLLASAGYRVIVPYVRGCGATRFLSGATFRNGQQAAVALDTIDMMDALRIKTAIVAGYDWGARTADIVAALWPERCKALVAVSGYLIGSQEANKAPLPPKAEYQWWYQYYFATDRGVLGYDKYRHDFAKLIWQIASPRWEFDDATFDRTAVSFNNPDYVAIVIHNYRWRLAWLKAKQNTMTWNVGLPKARSSPYPPSRLKVMPMVRHTRTPTPTARSLRANMRTGSSAAASVTTCLRKPRRLSPRRSSTSTVSDRRRTACMLAGNAVSAAQIRNDKVSPRMPRSAIRTATAGCPRRSRRICPDTSRRVTHASKVSS
jgi:pimeloyl-ACP methyl ester carboxylesterase